MTLASKILPILAVAGTMMVAPGAMMLDRDCCDVLLPATAARYLQGRARRLRWRTVHVRCRTMPAYWLTRARNGRYGYIANVIMRIASPLAALLVTAHRLSVPATTNPFLGVPGRRLADRGFGPGAAVCPPRAPISRMAAEAAGRSIPGPDDHRALVERCEAADEWSSSSHLHSLWLRGAHSPPGSGAVARIGRLPKITIVSLLLYTFAQAIRVQE